MFCISGLFYHVQDAAVQVPVQRCRGTHTQLFPNTILRLFSIRMMLTKYDT